MKMFHVLLLLAATSSLSSAIAVSPIGKVIQLLGDMEQKIIKEGELSQKSFTEFADMCEDRSKDLHHAIKTGDTQKAELSAEIEKQTSTAASLSAKLEELAGAIASDDAELKEATGIRGKEHADFLAEEKELVDVINTLERAAGIISREMNSGSASMMQIKNAGSIAQALTAMVDASMVSSADAGKLTALIQSSDSDEGVGAPDAAVYKSQSGGILDLLQDLQDKAEGQLDAARKKETNAKHNFEMLRQSLEDKIKFAEKDKSESSSSLASANENKAVAEGDLAVTAKTFDEDTVALKNLHHDCLTRSQEYEAELKSRAEELKALATAKKIIKEATSGAETAAYSFLQVNTQSSDALEAVKIIRDLGRADKSTALTQLSLRLASMVKGQGPFDKVKGLIKDMIDKLEKEGNADAEKEAFCDKEMAETRATKEDKEAKVAKLTTKIDQMTAKSSKLKEESADLQAQLANLAKAQVQMDKVRHEENDQFKGTKSDLEQGLNGVKQALSVLRDYYGKQDKAHSAGEGAGANIIGLLEVCESDFSKGLAEAITTEESSQHAYEEQTKANEIEKATKTADVKYKNKEATSLDKSISEATSDRSTEQVELDSSIEYLQKLNDQCVQMPMSYAERARRRQEEINGLKEALQLLSPSSFVQTRVNKAFRGSVMKA